MLVTLTGFASFVLLQIESLAVQKNLMKSICRQVLKYQLKYTPTTYDSGQIKPRQSHCIIRRSMRSAYSVSLSLSLSTPPSLSLSLPPFSRAQYRLRFFISFSHYVIFFCPSFFFFLIFLFSLRFLFVLSSESSSRFLYFYFAYSFLSRVSILLFFPPH